MKHFNEEPFSVALHPSGHYVLVGFADSLKLMTILIDDIPDGIAQYFASVHGSTIGIHSTWTFETVGYLKGHTGKVRSVCWSADDGRLVSCGLDGNVFDWNVRTLRKEAEYNCNGLLFSSVCFSPDSRLIYAVGSNGSIRQLLAAAYGLFVFRCHLSRKLETILSAGEDGCLWVYRTSKEEPKTARREKDWLLSDEVLMTKSDLTDNQRVTHDLRQRVEQLRAENDEQLRQKDAAQAERLQELAERHAGETAGLRHLAEALAAERRSNAARHADELGAARSARASDVDSATAAFEAKMAGEREKLAELEARLAEARAAWERQAADMDEFHAGRVAQVTEFYRAKIEERQAESKEVGLPVS
ncbi:Cilia- and flagella-associated protein 57 [Cladochytrium tenue]|nr:Cilia- and flagella-associated protein 57 [Cladochytrium tenue]